jgi:general secretion pathway protein L
MPQNAMTDALLSRPTATAGVFLHRAVAWWLAELGGMVPRSRVAAFRRLLGRDAQDTAILDLNGSRAALHLREPGRAAPLTVVLGDTPADAHDRVSALLRRHRSRNGVTVRLDPQQVFVATLDLPRAAERSLDAVMRHQVERMVPLPAEQICFAYCRLPRPANAATSRFAVAVAKRTTVEQAQALTRGIGLEARRIVAESAEAGALPLVIWRPDRAQSVTPARRRLHRALEAAALSLALAAYGLHVYRLEQVRADLSDAVAQAKQTAAATRALGQHVALSADALTFLRARRQEPQPLQVLDSLTRLLPLDSWVSDLTLRDRSVEIVGAAAHSTGLIPLIEGSPAFGRAKFRSPITLLPDGRTERFDLTFDVKPGDSNPDAPR